MPSVGELVALLAIAFVAAFVYIGFRFLRESKQQKLDREEVRAEIGRRAAAKGRRIENGTGQILWKQQGALSGGEIWTLEYCVGYRERMKSDVLEPDIVDRDWIAGQRLEWRCAALKRDSLAFSFYKRTDDKKAPDEIAFDPDDKLWWRWRLEARDEAIARRVFSPAVCELLLRLPLGIAFNTYIDQRTSITLGTDGLVAVLGVDAITPELVELWIETAEAMVTGAKG